MNDWIKNYERFWSHQIDRIKQRAEQKAQELRQQTNHPLPENDHGRTR